MSGWTPINPANAEGIRETFEFAQRGIPMHTLDSSPLPTVRRKNITNSDTPILPRGRPVPAYVRYNLYHTLVENLTPGHLTALSYLNVTPTGQLALLENTALLVEEVNEAKLVQVLNAALGARLMKTKRARMALTVEDLKVAMSYAKEKVVPVEGIAWFEREGAAKGWAKLDGMWVPAMLIEGPGGEAETGSDTEGPNDEEVEMEEVMSADNEEEAVGMGCAECEIHGRQRARA